jgi:hypothetical protein
MNTPRVTRGAAAVRATRKPCDTRARMLLFWPMLLILFLTPRG